MSRPRNTVPTYRRHKQTGRAVVSYYRTDGSRTEVILPGNYGSEQSKQEFERLLCQLRVHGGQLPADTAKKDFTIAELVLKFMEHASTYYADPVTKQPTTEVVACRDGLRPLCRLYADTPATEFGPLALQALRSAMVTGSWLTDEERSRRTKENRHVGLARTTTNKHVGRIKLLFKWAASIELLPASVHQALATVAGLRRGRSAARETKKVTPIASAVIDETLPYLPPVVRDMVEVLLLTGMRCGELCIMRPCDLDVTGDIWIYHPEKHKTLWLGKERVIAIGPKAQEIIRRYLTINTIAYLFSPAEQAEMIRRAKRKARKTRVQPSQADRSKANAKRKPGNRFRVGAVNRAIRAACKRAGIERWHIHQLRHSASLTFTRELGLESARAALGHATVNMSAMYAGHDLDAAKNVAQRVG